MVLPNIAGTLRASALVRERRLVPALPELERLLPQGGLLAGSLVDLHADEGAGALALALRIAARQQGPRHAYATGGAGRDAPHARCVVLVDATGDFYPQAAAQAGIVLERLIVLRRASSRSDSKWLLACLDETLRSRAVAAVIARVKKLDGASSHRLRVAAETGGGLGIFVRPLDERTAVSAAAVRLHVEPAAGRPFELAIEAQRVRCSGGSPTNGRIIANPFGANPFGANPVGPSTGLRTGLARGEP